MAADKVTHEPQYGGYEYQFVDKVPERYLCSIVCHKVLRDARLLVCCGNHVCETCLNSWLRSQGRLRRPLCPHCRQGNFKHVEDLSIRRVIKDLKIHCTNGKAGCTWEGALSDLKTHLEKEKGCGYVVVHCSNQCKKQLKRKHLADHLAQHCPLREYQCQHCGKEDTHQTITEKHYDKCPSYPLDCPNTCGGRGIKRAEMSQHRSMCQLEPVECPFKEAGCQAKLVRRELDSHVTTNQQQHLLTLMAAFREVKAELSASKAELSASKAELSAANKATTVMQELIAADVAIIQHGVEKQLKINPLHLECDGPALTIRMINFSNYKRSGKVWHSPPFYCDAGYKMQLAVYAKGTGAGASTHVSIALLLMKGELDDELEWPVPVNEICPSIVAQKSAVQRRVSHSIISAPNTASIDKLNFILCPKCTSAYHFQHDIVLEKEGVRELERKDRFVDHQTVNERLLNDSIVLKIQLTNHNHPVAMVPSHDRYATSTYRYGVQSARTEHTVSSSEYYVPSAGSYRQ